MQWIEQLQVELHPNDYLSRAVYISGLYEPPTMLALQRLLAPGGVFIDIGANAGLFSMVASRWLGASGRVYSFEPSAREYRRLIRHLELNALENITTMQKAIGRSEGSARLRVAAFPNAGLNTVGAAFAYEGVAIERFETVVMTTLDRFAREAALQRIDAIKLDIEGAEPAALAGARDVLKRFRPALIVEMSSRALASSGARSTDIIDALVDANYRLHRIEPDGHLTFVMPSSVPDDENIVALPLENNASDDRAIV
jgi:FkbM family methyltransferase